jgi:hypothetical protein
MPNYVSEVTPASAKTWADLLKKTNLVPLLQKHKIDQGAAVTAFSTALSGYADDVKAGVYGVRQARGVLDKQTKAIKPLLAKVGAATKQDFGVLTKFISTVEKELRSCEAVLKDMDTARGRVAATAPKAELAWASYARNAGASGGELARLLEVLAGCTGALTLADRDRWKKFQAKFAQIGQACDSDQDVKKVVATFDKELRGLLKEVIALAK